MTFMVWNSDLETGIDIIDRQHRGLVDLLNQAAPLLAISSKESLTDISPLLDRLLEYAATHFRTEEELMARLGMDDRASARHHASHAGFAHQIGDIVRAFSGADGVTGDRLLSFLASWLVLHILGEDQAMARQVHAIEAGATPAQAYESTHGEMISPLPDAISHAMVDQFTSLTQQNRAVLLANQALDASRVEIERHNHNLESMVQERTLQLERLAKDLRQARDAAEAGSRAKSRFLGAMSHELRTPMNAIMGFSRLLRDRGLPPAEQDLARRIVEASEHLLEVINGVVDFARLENDQISLHETVFSPALLLAEAGQRAFAAARLKGLGSRIEVDPLLPETLIGDQGLITRILAQFADNAVKFTRRGGIRLRAQQIGRAEQGQVRVRLLVEDSGIGIAQADQERLFKPFSQLDDRPDRQFEGIGLGLALARQLAGLMRGKVGVESELGKGSLFWLELNLRQGAADADVEPPLRPDAAAPPPTTAMTAAGGDLPQELLEVLHEIEQLLRAYDTRAAQVLRTAAPRLRAHLGERIEELGRLIADFDYDQALTMLNNMRAA